MKIHEILLVETFHKPGSLASVLAAIADERLAIEHLQALRDIFKGALEAAAPRFTDGMLVAAAHALAQRAGTPGGDRARVNRAFIIAF